VTSTQDKNRRKRRSLIIAAVGVSVVGVMGAGALSFANITTDPYNASVAFGTPQAQCLDTATATTTIDQVLAASGSTWEQTGIRVQITDPSPATIQCAGQELTVEAGSGGVVAETVSVVIAANGAIDETLTFTTPSATGTDEYAVTIAAP